MSEPTSRPAPTSADDDLPPPLFEFDERQGRVFASLSGAMSFLGTLVLIGGGLALLGDAVLTTAAVLRAVAYVGARGTPALGSILTAIPWELIVAAFGAVGAAMVMLLGRSLRNAAAAFGRVVYTQGGADTDYVVDAVRELTEVYAFGRLFMIYLVAGALIGVIVFVRDLRPM